MLLPTAHRVRDISIGIALILLLLQLYQSWDSSGHDGTSSFRVRRRSVDTTVTSHEQQISELDETSFNHTLPRNIDVVSPAKQYQNYVAKGCKLWSLLQRQTDAPGSQWTGANDLANWGWQSTAPAGLKSSESDDRRLAQLLGNVRGPLAEKGIGITTTDGMINIQTTHTARDKPANYEANAEYKATGAIFFEAYNAKQGAIIAYCNYGPAYYSKKDPDWGNAALPGMSSWSDVVSAVWTIVTNTIERRLLRYIIRINVVNEDTTDVVSMALKKVGQKNGIPPKWPGLTFAPPAATKLKEDAEMQKAFQAVLATPNVRGTVWLLLQHKWQLGAKTIKSITVWDMSGFENQNAGWELAIMVEVMDYAPT